MINVAAEMFSFSVLSGNPLLKIISDEKAFFVFTHLGGSLKSIIKVV